MEDEERFRVLSEVEEGEGTRELRYDVFPADFMTFGDGVSVNETFFFLWEVDALAEMKENEYTDYNLTSIQANKDIYVRTLHTSC